MTRLFREGRTETVRSCSNESSAFVKALENGEVLISSFILFSLRYIKFTQNFEAADLSVWPNPSLKLPHFHSKHNSIAKLIGPNCVSVVNVKLKDDLYVT